MVSRSGHREARAAVGGDGFGTSEKGPQQPRGATVSGGSNSGGRALDPAGALHLRGIEHLDPSPKQPGIPQGDPGQG